VRRAERQPPHCQLAPRPNRETVLLRLAVNSVADGLVVSRKPHDRLRSTAVTHTLSDPGRTPGDLAPALNSALSLASRMLNTFHRTPMVDICSLSRFSVTESRE